MKARFEAGTLVLAALVTLVFAAVAVGCGLTAPEGEEPCAARACLTCSHRAAPNHASSLDVGQWAIGPERGPHPARFSA